MTPPTMTKLSDGTNCLVNCKKFEEKRATIKRIRCEAKFAKYKTHFACLVYLGNANLVSHRSPSLHTCTHTHTYSYIHNSLVIIGVNAAITHR